MKTIILESLEELVEAPEYPVKYVSSKEHNEGFWMQIGHSEKGYTVTVKYKTMRVPYVISRFRRPAVWPEFETLKRQLINYAKKHDYELQRLYDFTKENV